MNKKSSKNKKEKTKKQNKKKSKEIIPPMKFNLTTASLEVDTDKLQDIIKEKEAEDSELEEQIEQSEIITPSEETRFTTPQKSSSPILKKVETATENLEENVASTPIAKTEETNIIDYSTQGSNYFSTGYNENRKYESAERAAPMVLRNADEELQEKEFVSLQDQMRTQRGFTRSNEHIVGGHIEERGGLPFERRERKYRTLKG